MNFIKRITCIVCLSFGVALSAFADSQGLPSTIGSPSNWPTTLTNGTAAPGVWVPIRINSGLGLQQVFAGADTNYPGSVITYGYPSTDGTNINWAQPWTLLTGSLNSANSVVVAVTNFNVNSLRGFAAMFLVTTNTSATNVTIGGALSNTYVINLVTNINTNVTAGLTWNRPNQ